MICVLHHIVITVLRNHDGHRTTRTHFLNVGNDLGVQVMPRALGWHDHKHRLSFFHQSDRPVFQLAGREPFRVQVGDLFELQSTLKCNREAHMPAKKQH